MPTATKSEYFSLRGNAKDQKDATPGIREETSLRYLFLTSFILVAVSCYIYPYLFVSQGKRYPKMMTSRSSRYSSFAGAIHEKLQNDRFWLEGDKSHWYHVEASQLPTTHSADEKGTVMSKFVQMDIDDETQRFITQSVEKADQLLTQMWHNLAKTVLKRFFGYTQTDINGYLRRGSMFVMSTQQYLLLREKAGMPSDTKNAEGSLIDLGAGDGRPTDSLRPFHKDIYATEASWAMRSILTEKGIDVLEIDEWDVVNEAQRKFDTISCLNLLDRCDEPLSILRRIKKALKPNGILLVALVLPFKSYVEWNSSHQPSELLLPTSLDGQNQESNEDSSYAFEKQIPSVLDMLDKEGFVVNAWTRLPYLCEGDMGQSLYVLSDAVLLCTLKD